MKFNISHVFHSWANKIQKSKLTKIFFITKFKWETLLKSLEIHKGSVFALNLLFLPFLNTFSLFQKSIYASLICGCLEPIGEVSRASPTVRQLIDSPLSRLHFFTAS